MAKEKKFTVNASFTGREMEAIAAMLLSNEGINVDPIIDDLYPNLEENAKKMFRCKLALMLKGNLPEFEAFEGYRRMYKDELFKFRCTSESSLLGTRNFEIIEVYNKVVENTDGVDAWNLVEGSDYVGTIRCENFDYMLYPTMEEAIKRW